MNKQAYEQGFVDACNYYGINPTVLVKYAQDAAAAEKASLIDKAKAWAKENPNTVLGLGAGTGAAVGGGLGYGLSKKNKIRNAILAALAGGAAGAAATPQGRAYATQGYNKSKEKITGLFSKDKKEAK